MAIKLITVDIDGTLIRDDLTVSAKTRDAIRKAKQKGITIILCTGRPHIAAKYFAEMLEIQGYQISHNGSIIQHTHNKELLLNDSLEKRLVVGINELCKKEPKLTLSLFYGDDCFLEKADNFTLHVHYDVNLVKPIFVADVNRIVEDISKEPTKILITGEMKDLDEYLVRLKKIYGDRANIFKSGPRFLDIISNKASKGRALKVLSEKLKIARTEIMAIGDNFNDLDMLSFAGIGVAMGNAPEEVKQHADVVVPSNNEDGVAYALEQLLL